MHKFDYRWTLVDAHFTKDKGTVFSCACAKIWSGSFLANKRCLKPCQD